MREFEQRVETEPRHEMEFEAELETGLGRSTPTPDVLNIGCGEDYRPDAWNVDRSPAVEPDEVVDLEQTPWPWMDGAFRRVVAAHVLEHLDPVPWTELVRVIEPGGVLRWTYPIGTTRFEDPTHKQFWNWNTAEAVAGDRAHGHQFVDGLRLTDRRLRWSVPGSKLWRWYTSLRLHKTGAGPWLSNIPGLYGEVEAVYRREK